MRRRRGSLERIVVEDLLVLREQLHVGRDDLLADVLEDALAREERVVHLPNKASET